jgi:predicted unusual protein kinase regulating ubiquinone biosynthesis (AarF/ABC1/UbiB family)
MAQPPSSPLRHRLGRALRLGATSARAGAGWAGAALLERAGRRAGASARARASAAQVAAALGDMKGLAMKVGQYLSFALPDLPPEWVEALAVLQTRSAPLPFEEVAAVVELELDRPLDEAFRDFERAPVAAASIGQVHRARLPDGTPVAVKVQYPGVAAAVRADLANAAVLARALRLLLPGLEAAEVAAELRARIGEELDYRGEARRQAAFAARFAGHPFIAIPPVFPSHSAAAVLTTGWAPGRDFADLRRDPPEVRAGHGEILLRFLLGCALRDGTFVADPHPGNYRFDAGGARVTFLDFGCVKSLGDATRDGLRTLVRGALEGDRRVLQAGVAALGLVAPGRAGDAVLDALAHLYAPFRPGAATPFPPVLSGPVLRDAAGGALAAVRRELHVSGELPFLNRTVVGLYAVLGRLGAAAPWHRIAREYACGDAPSTPLGAAERTWLAARSAPPGA